MSNETTPEIKTIYKAIFAWEDEKEEKWLEQMAADGWKLISVAPYVYKFQRSEPERIIFRLDYKNTLDKDYQEYLSLFEDAGWELFTTFANWQYFKIKPENNEVPEIYNSGKAKAQKYRRLLLGIVVFMPIYVILLNPIFRYTEEESNGLGFGFLDVIRIIITIFVLFMAYAFFRILAKIKKLESESKE
ncbi:MAG: DUF2812 domain-containing protein [Anaerolineaceae bacterium]|jgi:hypothetical protein|nr:DUF2812 domain-containing protein [Acetobacterium sp.]MDP3449832.1 DUF2812 domain-containing protein [Anaerolineaceae bacterium]